MTQLDFLKRDLKEWIELREQNKMATRRFNKKFEELKAMLGVSPICTNVDIVEDALKIKIADEVLKQ